MKSHEILKAATDRIGVKALAAALRLSPAMVYKWCEPPDHDVPEASGALNPLDRIREIYRLTTYQPLIDWLCEQANGCFVPNPPSQPDLLWNAEWLRSSTQAVRDFSQLMSEICEAAADDGAVAVHDAERLRAEWQRLKSVAESFVVACERIANRQPLDENLSVKGPA